MRSNLNQIGMTIESVNDDGKSAERGHPLLFEFLSPPFSSHVSSHPSPFGGA